MSAFDRALDEILAHPEQLTDDGVRVLAARLRDAQTVIADERDRRIRIAHAAGGPAGGRPTDLASAWGLTRGRIYQILDADD